MFIIVSLKASSAVWKQQVQSWKHTCEVLQTYDMSTEEGKNQVRSYTAVVTRRANRLPFTGMVESFRVI